VPLHNPDGTYNAIIEIPKWTRRKFEIATGELYNPIRQDVKNGVLRVYTYGDQLFNYGALPQTWEDPSHFEPESGTAGDNDPLDVIELGSKQWQPGSIVRVKVLGVLGLVDAGETDWKVIGISAEDPLAPLLNDLDDINVHLPGVVDALRNWLRVYKMPVVNTFLFDGAARDAAFATETIEQTHRQWVDLVEGRGRSSSGSAAAGPSIVSAGLKRSTSRNALASLMGGPAYA
jgi:inorganic pyrophosphatase